MSLALSYTGSHAVAMVNMASSIASSLDFDVRSGLLPFDKLRNAALTV